MSVADRTSCDSAPMACPNCWVNIALPTWLRIPSIGPAIACASPGSAAHRGDDVCRDRLDDALQVGMLASTHSARLQAATGTGAGSSVAESSQCSATWATSAASR